MICYIGGYYWILDRENLLYDVSYGDYCVIASVRLNVKRGNSFVKAKLFVKSFVYCAYPLSNREICI